MWSEKASEVVTYKWLHEECKSWDHSGREISVCKGPESVMGPGNCKKASAEGEERGAIANLERLGGAVACRSV